MRGDWEPERIELPDGIRRRDGGVFVPKGDDPAEEECDEGVEGPWSVRDFFGNTMRGDLDNFTAGVKCEGPALLLAVFDIFTPFVNILFSEEALLYRMLCVTISGPGSNCSRSFCK